MGDPGGLAPDVLEEPAGTGDPAVATPAARAGAPRGEKVHRRRFVLVYSLLGVVLAGAIAGLVVVALEPGKSKGPLWSAWQPTATSEADRAREIADHVAAQYRLESGSQLVGVQAAPPRVQDIPLGAIAVRRPPGFDPDNAVTVLPVDGTIVYILCGLGPECAIAEGDPSLERLRLLRREALELALYSFRYLGDVSQVVAFLPPSPGETASFALLFRRGELSAALERPLRSILPVEPAPLPEEIGASETAAIDRLTGPAFFRFSFQQLQDGTAVLVLDDPTLPPPEAEESDGTQATQ